MHIIKLSRLRKSSRAKCTLRFPPPRHLGYPLGAIFDLELGMRVVLGLGRKHKMIIDSIGKIPLFQGLPERQIAELARIAVERSYKQDDSIFSEGDEAKGFYVLLSGRVIQTVSGRQRADPPYHRTWRAFCRGGIVRRFKLSCPRGIIKRNQRHLFPKSRL